MIRYTAIVSNNHRFVKREITENNNYKQSLSIFRKIIDKATDMSYS